MSLAPGTQLGPYQILSPLGAGGMGEVYRSRDTRLDRTVAIKILPKEVSSDPVRKQRFEREAKIISNLNHPHICVLHDAGSQDGLDYLVMECIEGETLAKRLLKGSLPLDQVLKYGAQIADALDKAHRSGVVHRDLKPGNIMLTPTGAKLLDFGLAKPAAVMTNAATLTLASPNPPVTQDGTIVGTFQYMSPEQIEGKELDGRSDIFSLGAVLYEMLTGRRAFEGKSQLSVVSAILEKEPSPINSVKPLTPPGLDHAIRRCLAKDPDERWQMARDLAMELKWIAEAGSQADISATAKGSRSRQWFPWAVTATVSAIVLAAFVAYQQLTVPASHAIVSDIVPPKGTQFTFLVNGPAAISPDGRAIAFSALGSTGKTSLWVRSLDESPAQPIPGTEEASGLFWSPDSRKIGFFQHRKVTIFELPGGPAVTLTDNIATGGASWSQAGIIVFSGEHGIYQVPASGGPAVQVLPRDTSKYAFTLRPVFMPDGKHFLYVAANPNSGDVFFASLDGKENRLLLQGTGKAIYASGFLLYTRTGSVLAQPFDPVSGKLAGTPRPIVEQVQQGTVGGALFSASQDGTLIYEPATQAPTVTQLALFDRSGKKLSFIGVPEIHYDLRFSPDAHRLASSAGGPKSEMWVDDLDRNVHMRLTIDPDSDHGIPVWSPDGKTLLYSTLRGSKAGIGIFSKPSNGAGSEELFLPSDRPDREVWATDWSRDGRFLLLSHGDMVNNSEADIWVLPMTDAKKAGDKKPIPFLRTAPAVYDAQFSPDGRWVAYTSIESGSHEVYVVSFDAAKVLSPSATGNAPGGRWQISSNGGHTPRWRRDSKELFYIGPENTIMAVEVDGKGAGFEIGRTQRLFTAPVSPFAATYDVTPDGQRFVMSAAPEQEEAPLVLISDWPARLQGK